MNTKTEKRKAALINIVYIFVLLAIIYVFFKYCFTVAAPFIVSFFFAMVLQKPLKFLDKRTKNKVHTLWSILLVLLSISIILVPFILLIAALVKEIIGFGTYLMDQLSDLPTFLATLENEILNLLKFLPDAIYTSVADSVTEFFGRMISGFDISALGIDMKAITGGLTTGITGVFNVVRSIPSALIAIVITIIAWIFFTKDYKTIVTFIKRQLPDGKKNLLSETKQVFSKTILKMLRAYGIIMFITFCELFLGLSILNLIGVMHNNYVVIIAMAIAIFDILPVAGSGGVLIPWMLVNLVLGNFGAAIGLLVIYAAISVIRQYIEPKIVGDSLGVHPIVTLAGLYFGLKLFGFMGMFIVPITLMTLKAFNDSGRLHLYNGKERN